MAAVAVYIDGFNLYYGMKNKYGRRYHWLDVVHLARRLRPRDDVVVVRYFSAIVKDEPVAAENQHHYLDALRTQNGSLVDIRLGRFRVRGIGICRRCRQPYTCACPREYRSYEEKETDVALGAMMVADAARGVCDTTMLISADTDLAPALAAVRLVMPEQRLYLAMPPGNAGPSRHLTSVGDIGHFFINEAALRNSQLPATVTDPVAGRVLTRPAKWS
jgi:uncharacterized LabA/DUF88 family protein